MAHDPIPWPTLMRDLFISDPDVYGSVLVRRGPWIESRHRVHVVVVDAAGHTLAAVGDPSVPTFFRSAAKPFQALPLVEDGVVDALGLDDEALALCCASHNSEPRQVEVARSILSRIGLGEDALACGGHPPLRKTEELRLAAAGTPPSPIDSNCSGKHAGMLALARHHGWPVEGYERADHPVQRRVIAAVADQTGLDSGDLETAVDGCGVVCIRGPLRQLALGYARLAAASAAGAPAPRRIVGAMTAHPEMVGGVGRLDTAVMVESDGAVVAKVGAEGVYGAALPQRGIGVALKVEDGSWRAADVALVRVLDQLGWVPEAPSGSLADFRAGAVFDTRGVRVGEITADFEMEVR